MTSFRFSRVASLVYSAMLKALLRNVSMRGAASTWIEAANSDKIVTSVVTMTSKHPLERRHPAGNNGTNRTGPPPRAQGAAQHRQRTVWGPQIHIFREQDVTLLEPLLQTISTSLVNRSSRFSRGLSAPGGVCVAFCFGVINGNPRLLFQMHRNRHFWTVFARSR